MKKVVVAPLNWGLGHASRCVPIIKELQKNNFTLVIASDGDSLSYLKKEFSKVEFLELPSYQISYGKNLKWSLFLKLPRFFKTLKKEQKVLQKYLQKNTNVVGIISDNRFGIHSKDIPSVYITHQINVLSGFSTKFTTYFHQRIIKKFNECWIPDKENSLFSGKLSKTDKKLNQKYIGILSRFEAKISPQIIDVLIVLSGPEPNRSNLESKLVSVFKTSKQNICLVLGKVEKTQITSRIGNIDVVNFMLADELEKALNSSKLVICRAGYSSIMDLAVLNKKAILIPTKFQNEQEYLAKYLQEEGFFPYINESNIDEQIVELSMGKFDIDYKNEEFNPELFHLFKGK